MKTCSICQSEFAEFGNNPAPFPSDNDERCCDDCNTRFVVPVRMLTMDIRRRGVDPNGPLMHILAKIAEIGRGMQRANEKFRVLQKEGKIPGAN